MRARLPALLLGCVLALAGCTSLEGTGDKGYISGNGQVMQLPPADRGEPVEMTGEDLDGQRVSLEELRGQVVVVNVWWSGCPPCRTEMPMLVETAESERDAAFMGINIRDSDQAQAKAFVRNFQVPYPSVFDPSGKALLAFDGILSPTRIPSTVVLDTEGRIASTVIGPLPSARTLQSLIDEAGTADG